MSKVFEPHEHGDEENDFPSDLTANEMQQVQNIQQCGEYTLQTMFNKSLEKQTQITILEQMRNSILNSFTVIINEYKTQLKG